jgi:hypothetical protein
MLLSSRIVRYAGQANGDAFQTDPLPCAVTPLSLLAHLLPAVPHVAEPASIASDAGSDPRDWAVVQPPPKLAGAHCVLLDQCESAPASVDGINRDYTSGALSVALSMRS